MDHFVLSTSVEASDGNVLAHNCWDTMALTSFMSLMLTSPRRHTTAVGDPLPITGFLSFLNPNRQFPGSLLPARLPLGASSW